MPTVTIALSRTLIHVKTPVAEDIKKDIKGVSGYAFNQKAQRFEFPLDPIVVRELLALRKVDGIELQVEKRLIEWYKKEMTQREAILAAMRDKEPELKLAWSNLLYPHQPQAVNIMATAEKLLLTDDMGLGKTVETMGAVLESIANKTIDSPDGPFLIIAPKSVIMNWQKEVKNWLGEDMQILKKCDEKEMGDLKGWYGINWDLTFRRPELFDVKWKVIVGDESHAMINRDSKRTKAVMKLGKNVRFKYLLSGTPIRGGAEDLWPQLNFLYPERFTSYWRFVQRYIEVEEDFFGHKKNIGTKDETLEELRSILQPVMWGRTLEESGMELPPAFPHTVKCTMGKRQKKVYDEMVDQFVAWIDDAQEEMIISKGWLTQVLRLQQIAGSLGIFSEQHTDSAKLDKLDEVVKSVDTMAKLRQGKNANPKFVVMSKFKTMVEQTCKRWVKDGYSFCRMDGDHTHVWDGKEFTEYKTRQELIDRYQNDPSIKFFIATTQTGGVGLTLTAANHFAFLDRMWVPGENVQAWKRIHRIGQTEACHIWNFMAEGSVDYSALNPTLKRKEDIVAALKPDPNAEFEGEEW